MDSSDSSSSEDLDEMFDYSDDDWDEDYLDSDDSNVAEQMSMVEQFLKLVLLEELQRERNCLIDDDSDMDLSVTSSSGDDDDDFSDYEMEKTTRKTEDTQWIREPIDMKTVEFTGTPGLLIPVPRSKEPIVYFNLLVDDRFYNMILGPTNARAKKIFFENSTTREPKMSKKEIKKDKKKLKEELAKRMKEIAKNKPNSNGNLSHSSGQSDTQKSEKSKKSDDKEEIRNNAPQANDWKDLTKDELRIFLSLLYQSGQENKFSDFIASFSGGRMTAERFILIGKAFCFTEEKDTEESRLYKIKPLVDYFNEKMDKIYYPGKNLIIDDPMVLVDGRITSRKQAKKNGCSTYGVKLFSLTAPRGLVQKVNCFLNFHDLKMANTRSKPGHVVMEMMEGILDKGHSLFTNQSVTSIPLARKLLKRNTYMTGIIRRRRKENPRSVTSKILKTGQTCGRYCKGIGIHKWQTTQTNPNYIVSTEFSGTVKSVDNNEKPQSFLSYIELTEQASRPELYGAFYPAQLTKLSWHRKFAVHILQLLLTNSWLLHKMYSGKTVTFEDYRTSVLKSLVEPPQDEGFDELEHKIQAGDKTEDGNTVKTICEVCKSKGKKKFSFFICPACPGRPGLCIACFKIYHSNKK